MNLFLLSAVLNPLLWLRECSLIIIFQMIILRSRLCLRVYFKQNLWLQTGALVRRRYLNSAGFLSQTSDFPHTFPHPGPKNTHTFTHSLKKKTRKATKAAQKESVDEPNRAAQRKARRKPRCRSGLLHTQLAVTFTSAFCATQGCAFTQPPARPLLPPFAQ